MKSLKIKVALLLACGVTFVSCVNKVEVASTENTTTKIANAETTSFDISGMKCQMGCAKAIENKLADLDGVQNAKVNFENKTATIQYDASIQSPEKIVETVEAVADGKTYKVANVKNSADQAYLFQEPKQDKKKNKQNKKDQATASATNDMPVLAAPAEAAKCGTVKKAGCCSAKKTVSCSSEKSTSL